MKNIAFPKEFFVESEIAQDVFKNEPSSHFLPERLIQGAPAFIHHGSGCQLRPKVLIFNDWRLDYYLKNSNELRLGMSYLALVRLFESSTNFQVFYYANDTFKKMSSAYEYFQLIDNGYAYTESLTEKYCNEFDVSPDDVLVLQCFEMDALIRHSNSVERSFCISDLSLFDSYDLIDTCLKYLDPHKHKISHIYSDKTVSSSKVKPLKWYANLKLVDDEEGLQDYSDGHLWQGDDTSKDLERINFLKLGDIAQEIDFKKYKNLRHLNLASTSFPPQVFHDKNIIEYLVLDNISAKEFDCYQNMSNLKGLSLKNSDITENIYKNLINLKLLTVKGADNALKKIIKEPSIKNLEILVLSDLSFSLSDLKIFCQRNQKLKRIVLTKVRNLEGTKEMILNLSSLEELRIEQCYLTPQTIVNILNNTPKLKHLKLEELLESEVRSESKKNGCGEVDYNYEGTDTLEFTMFDFPLDKMRPLNFRIYYHCI